MRKAFFQFPHINRVFIMCVDVRTHKSSQWEAIRVGVGERLWLWFSKEFSDGASPQVNVHISPGGRETDKRQTVWQTDREKDAERYAVIHGSSSSTEASSGVDVASPCHSRVRMTWDGTQLQIQPDRPGSKLQPYDCMQKLSK